MGIRGGREVTREECVREVRVMAATMVRRKMDPIHSRRSSVDSTKHFNNLVMSNDVLTDRVSGK